MSQFDAGAWQSADPNADMESNDPPAPGTYDVVIADAKAFTSSKGNDIAIIEWNITGGPQTGYQWPAIYTFKNEGSIKAAKATCTRIGIDVDTISGLDDLDAQLRQQIGEYFTVEVKQNGEWRNTYVQGRASQAPLSDVPNDFVPAGSPAADDEEDIPFAFEPVPDWCSLKTTPARW